jgi:membrane protease YdiL (CAAX protease family)
MKALAANLTILCFGLIYAIYYYRTRRLWPLILAHDLFDLDPAHVILSTHH